MWLEASRYTINLVFSAQKEIHSLRLVGDSVYDPFFKVFNPLPEGIMLETRASLDRDDWQTCSVSPAAARVFQQSYRGFEDSFEATIFTLDRSMSQLRLSIPAPDQDSMLVLNEVEVFSTTGVSPAIRFFTCTDLSGSGQKQVIACNDNHELLVLTIAGDLLWRRQLPCSATHLSCHDLDGNGCKQICIGLLNGDIRVYSPGGDLRQTIHLKEDMLKRSDIFFGWLDVANEIQVWQRDGSGKAALMVGGYGIVVFLDVDGHILGHSFADGSWVYSLLAITGQNKTDIWARTGWNHGIMVYRGASGWQPSGERASFGNIHQPMFRKLQKVIPFVNGKTVIFKSFPAGDLSDDHIVIAAAADGFGILSVANLEWLWKIEGGTPLTACLVREDGAGRKVVITGGADGFIACFALLDGQPLTKVYAGGPITGLVWLAQPGLLVVGTPKRLLTLNQNWNILACREMEVARLLQIDDRKVCVSRKDGQISILEWIDSPATP